MDQLDAIFGSMKAGMDNVGNKAAGEFKVCFCCGWAGTASFGGVSFFGTVDICAIFRACASNA